MSSVGWLNGFDPNNAATIASSLGNLLPKTAKAPSGSWLSGFDPANPAGSLGNLLPKTAPASPSAGTTPAGFNVLNPTPLGAPAGPTQLQQALNSFKVTADTYLIQSAINGYQPLAAPAAFGSTAGYYQGLNSSAQAILQAGKSGNYGNVNALA